MENGLDIVSYKIGKEHGGVTPTGEIDITQNGITNVSGYATANVQVPEPSGTINITQNGETNVKNYETANVNVPQPSGKITITQNGTDIDVSSYASADVSVGGLITNVGEANQALSNSLNAFINYLNTREATFPGYTDEPLTLYTPSENNKQYLIQYSTTNQKYNVYWLPTNTPMHYGTYYNTHYIARCYFGGQDSIQVWKNEENGYYLNNYAKLKLTPEGTSGMNLWYTGKSYDTLEDIIADMTNPETQWTNWKTGNIYADNYINICSNKLRFKLNENNVYAVWEEGNQRISSNETIAVIPSE